MNKFKNSVECFSDECGFCSNCCSNLKDSTNKIIYKKEEINERSIILGKMIGKEGLEEHKRNYNKKLNEWCKNRGYEDPMLYGWAQEKVKRGDHSYRLKLEKHNIVCSNTYCRMLYESETSWEQKKYNKYPIYVRDSDGLGLCAFCVDKD
jgi:hypothetical protein